MKPFSCTVNKTAFVVVADCQSQRSIIIRARPSYLDTEAEIKLLFSHNPSAIYWNVFPEDKELFKHTNYFIKVVEAYTIPCVVKPSCFVCQRKRPIPVITVLLFESKPIKTLLYQTKLTFTGKVALFP